MYRHRHVIAALLVAPLLAVLAWFAVGAFVGETPLPAERGRSYPLVEQSGCRYASGVCELRNSELRLTLRADERPVSVLQLNSSHALDQVLMAVSESSSGETPLHMMPVSSEGRIWTLPLERMPGQGARIRLVASRSGSVFFADASTAFLRESGEVR